jgi:ribosomal protein S18 acetylase RimI-like enzyme
MTVIIRPANANDRDAIHEICLKTGDNGADGTALYHYPELLSAVYVDPYLRHDLSCCFVAEDEEGVCGYTLSALNARKTLEWAEREYLPALREKFPVEGVGTTRTPHDQELVMLLHEPFKVPEFAEQYPSELHIDLLPRAQGKGLGRLLIQRLWDELRKQGSAGVFLGVGWENRRAQAFYRHLGFEELVSIPGSVIFFGKRFDAEANESKSDSCS